MDASGSHSAGPLIQVFYVKDNTWLLPALLLYSDGDLGPGCVSLMGTVPSQGSVSSVDLLGFPLPSTELG